MIGRKNLSLNKLWSESWSGLSPVYIIDPDVELCHSVNWRCSIGGPQGFWAAGPPFDHLGDQSVLVEVLDVSGPQWRSLGSHVTAGMFGQMVTAHEAPLAHAAHKLLLTGVCPAVTGKLIRTGKLFITAVPMATEGFLTWKEESMDMRAEPWEADSVWVKDGGQKCTHTCWHHQKLSQQKPPLSHTAAISYSATFKSF